MRRAAFLGLLLLPAAARADEVYTRGGGHLSGEIVERGPDSIVVDIGVGKIGLPLSYVERIVEAPSPVALYRRRAEQLAPHDASGWVALGQWARQQELRGQADEAFRHALTQDPDHAGAHQALGHVRHGDRWLSLEESYRAQGLVPYDGRWITAAEQQALLAERVAAAELARAEADAHVQVREAEARVRESEARARLAEAEARLAETDARRAESAEVGIFRGGPLLVGFSGVPLGFNPAVRPGFHRGFLPGCDRARGFVTGAWGRPLVVPLAGRGGALIAAHDRHNPAVRH
jgi:hypothetical protein